MRGLIGIQKQLCSRHSQPNLRLDTVPWDKCECEKIHGGD